jgi:hypothetical protein
MLGLPGEAMQVEALWYTISCMKISHDGIKTCTWLYIHNIIYTEAPSAHIFICGITYCQSSSYTAEVPEIFHASSPAISQLFWISSQSTQPQSFPFLPPVNRTCTSHTLTCKFTYCRHKHNHTLEQCSITGVLWHNGVLPQGFRCTVNCIFTCYSVKKTITHTYT